MTTLSDLKSQQSEMREMTAALLNLLSPEQQAVGTIAHVTHTLLCDLCEKVTEHLAEENKGVYPVRWDFHNVHIEKTAHICISRVLEKVMCVWAIVNRDEQTQPMLR